MTSGPWSIEMLRVDDPRLPVLIAAGATVVARSWGARLDLRAEGVRDRLVAHRDAVGSGVRLGEVGPDAASALLELQQANRADYSHDPALALPPVDLAATAAQWSAGGRVFAAVLGERMVGATVLVVVGDRARTTFTSVLREHRRHGVGSALKAVSLLALGDEGVRSFRTGGGDDNEASLRANLAVGYEVDEHWVTLRSPQADPPA